MKLAWERTISELIKDFDKIDQIECPSCEKSAIDYIYIGDGDTRIGYLQVWCKQCFRGIYVSRAAAPPNAKFVTFETDLKGIVPKKIEFVNV